jgi:hypothetical protein
VVFIPIGRAINPVSGDNWERTGVTPDVIVPAEHALNEAHRLALKAIIEGIGEPASGAVGALMREAQAALEAYENSTPAGT